MVLNELVYYHKDREAKEVVLIKENFFSKTFVEQLFYFKFERDFDLFFFSTFSSSSLFFIFIWSHLLRCERTREYFPSLMSKNYFVCEVIMDRLFIYCHGYQVEYV